MPHPTREGGTLQQQGMPPMVQPPSDPPSPVLFEDLQPIYLARLYPKEVAGGLSAASSAALEAGNAAREQGMALVAAQQEPIAGTEEPPPPHMPPRAERHEEQQHGNKKGE